MEIDLKCIHTVNYEITRTCSVKPLIMSIIFVGFLYIHVVPSSIPLYVHVQIRWAITNVNVANYLLKRNIHVNINLSETNAYEELSVLQIIALRPSDISICNESLQ